MPQPHALGPFERAREGGLRFRIGPEIGVAGPQAHELEARAPVITGLLEGSQRQRMLAHVTPCVARAEAEERADWADARRRARLGLR